VIVNFGSSFRHLYLDRLPLFWYHPRHVQDSLGWSCGFLHRKKCGRAETSKRSNALAIETDTRSYATVQVIVRDNNVDQALKALKKKMQREGIFREMKLRGHYEKPSEKRAREKAEAIRRARKLARKKAQREGLIPGGRR
jgi:small subunit ribosomal protein S21